MKRKEDSFSVGTGHKLDWASASRRCNKISGVAFDDRRNAAATRNGPTCPAVFSVVSAADSAIINQTNNG